MVCLEQVFPASYSEVCAETIFHKKALQTFLPRVWGRYLNYYLQANH